MDVYFVQDEKKKEKDYTNDKIQIQSSKYVLQNSFRNKNSKFFNSLKIPIKGVHFFSKVAR